MEWQWIVALVLAIPIVCFPALLVWAAVTSGLYQVAREALRRRGRTTEGKTKRSLPKTA